MNNTQIKQNDNTYWHDVKERFVSHNLAVAGLFFLTILIIVVTLFPIILQLDPYTSYAVGGFNQSPSSTHWLGTDRTGRDVFARLIYGGRVSLTVGLMSTIVSMLIGIPLGLLSGYYRGWIEALIMRIVDIFMSFPAMMLILVLVAVIGPSIISITCVLGFMGWTQFARLIHSKVLSVREKDYIEAARAIGTKNWQIMTRDILPNSFAPCLIAVTFRTAAAILMEAALSFLGMGVQPPTASWGNLMYDAQSIVVLSRQPWIWIPPGLFLVLTVLSINFLGDGLRDALDPKMKI